MDSQTILPPSPRSLALAALMIRLDRDGYHRPNPCATDDHPVIPRYPGDTWADWYERHPDADPDTDGADASGGTLA